MRLISLFTLLAISAFSAFAEKVLVLVQDEGIKTSHSQLLENIKSKGHTLDIRVAGETVKFRDFDRFLYDHLILLAPRAKSLGSELPLEAVLEFVDKGHNVLVAGDKNASQLMRDIAAGVGIKFDTQGSSLFDHFNYNANMDNDHTAVVTDAVFVTPALFGSEKAPGPILYRGTALLVPRHSELVLKALVAPDTAYSAKKGETLENKKTIVAGQMATLVALMQARNNARVAVLGSLDMLSNDFFAASIKVAESGKTIATSGNRAFANAVLSWTLQDRGVLRVKAVRHFVRERLGAPIPEENPSQYRINDEVTFEMTLEERRDGKWIPYTSDDIQVEFVMLDPYVRKTLTPHPSRGVVDTEFKVPDVYGVFKYVLKYVRPGYSRLERSITVPVRPFRHNEYERFIPAAFPYYASAFSMMAGFLLFGFYFNYHV